MNLSVTLLQKNWREKKMIETSFVSGFSLQFLTLTQHHSKHDLYFEKDILP